jgi:hypothetical protein
MHKVGGDANRFAASARAGATNTEACLSGRDRGRAAGLLQQRDFAEIVACVMMSSGDRDNETKAQAAAGTEQERPAQTTTESHADAIQELTQQHTSR